MMDSFAKYDLIIFDFHKTLTNSVYFDQFDPPTRERISDLIFRPPNSEIWNRRWMTGKIDSQDVLHHLSEKTEIDIDRLEGVLTAGLQALQWNPEVWHFSQSIRTLAKTAIVTINTDLFNRFVVPRFNLTSQFDAVVNSYDLGEFSKAKLCISAATELGLNLQDHQILLIDDKPENLDEFVAAGGFGYQYQNDDTFREWLKRQSRPDASSIE